MERVSKLETSAQQWKGRVAPSDAAKFTVAHKMASTTSVPSLLASKLDEPSSGNLMVGALSPASERKKKCPTPKVFKSKTGSSIPDIIERKTNEQQFQKRNGIASSKELNHARSASSERSQIEG